MVEDDGEKPRSKHPRLPGRGEGQAEDCPLWMFTRRLGDEQEGRHRNAEASERRPALR